MNKKDYINYAYDYMSNENHILDKMEDWTLEEFQIYFGHDPLTGSKLNNYVCDCCGSDDIKRIKAKENELDCYCNNCKEYNYIVYSGWINKNIGVTE